MGRKKLEYSDIFPYHLYGRANNSEWFHISMDECWSIFSVFLKYVSTAYNFKIHAFVLMNNHYHLIASAPDNNLALIMNRLLTEVSIAINQAAGRTNHVFGGQYRATIIKNGFHFLNALKYVYQNPIAVGLCAQVEDYNYSTIGSLIGKYPSIIPLGTCEIFTNYAPNDHIEFIALMNKLYTSEQREIINKTMRRTEYRIDKRKEKKYF